MSKKISEFKEGESLTLPLLLVQVTKGVTSNGSPYLSLTLQDKSGTIEGKIWDVKEEQAAACVPGRVGEVSCEVLRYRNSLQLRVHRLTPMDQQSIELSDYVIASDIPKELLQQKIQDAISSLSNPVYKGIVSALFAEYDKPFFDYPAAAKNHHNFVGGLAVHVTGMVDLANEIVKLYPLLDRDLLVSGVLVHDLGKLTELSGPVMTEYTLEGKLIGHISIMQAKIMEVAVQLGYEKSEEAILLRHMVLSHHGQLEFGSPVMPMVAEAEVLHLIDNLDARMNTLDKAYAQTEPGSFTSRLFPMENRAFYKPKSKKNEKKDEVD